MHVIRMPLAVLVATLGVAPVLAADPAHPVVVELYQSQGCSSCPPAIVNINAIAGRSDVLALTFAVTYWDQLGWKDTFAKPAFTTRQWDYARTGGRSQVATPQTIINGLAVTNGGNQTALLQAIRRADRGTSGPAIKVANGRLTVGAGSTTRPATVWLVCYDSRLLDVPIRAGENAGKTLAHRNVVRSIDRLGSWNGVRATFTVPAAGHAAYRTAVLVQQGTGGAIVAAAKL
jgi:hypothetical protein